MEYVVAERKRRKRVGKELEDGMEGEGIEREDEKGYVANEVDIEEAKIRRASRKLSIRQTQFRPDSLGKATQYSVRPLPFPLLFPPKQHT